MHSPRKRKIEGAIPSGGFMDLVYLGPPGSFSGVAAEKAAERMNGESPTLHPVPTLDDVAKWVVEHPDSLGILPGFNLLRKYLRCGRDLIDRYHLDILTMHRVPVMFDLAQQRGNTDHTRIFARQEAWDQCTAYIKEHYPQSVMEPTHSTSAAAKTALAQSGLALTNPRSSELYSLEVLATDIGDKSGEENFTEFYVVAKNAESNLP